MSRFAKLAFTGDVELVIGGGDGCAFRYADARVRERHASLSHVGGRFVLTSLARGATTQVNSEALGPLERRGLVPGDVVRIADLVVAVGDGLLSVGAPAGFVAWPVPGVRLLEHGALRERGRGLAVWEGELASFSPSPRLARALPRVSLAVDGPPARERGEERSLALQLGPSLLMGVTSALMAASSLARLAGGGGDVSSALPSASMAVTMVTGSLAWPVIAQRARLRRDARAEARRSQLYVAYLDGVERRLSEAAAAQAQVLCGRRPPVGDLLRQAAEAARSMQGGAGAAISPAVPDGAADGPATLCPPADGSASPAGDGAPCMLMSRTGVHDDFMELRVGVGDLPLDAEISWPERHFSLDDDRMLDRVDGLAARLPRLRDVPLAFDPRAHFVTGIVGPRAEAWSFARGLLAQVCALHSHRDVRVVLIGERGERAEWGFLAPLAHVRGDGGVGRLMALTDAGLVALDRLLGGELERRGALHAADPADLGPHFLVVCANGSLAGRSSSVARILGLRTGMGISLLYLGDGLRDLPRECGFIIDLAPGRAGGPPQPAGRGGREGPRRRACMFERADVAGTLAWFDPDVQLDQDAARAFALNLARLRLADAKDREGLPDSCGLLAALRVGNVGQLQVARRWARSDASLGLAAPLGVDAQGAPLLLDLHEGVHGPHGLVAGTTGSGKSELVIAYVTSLAVTYAPDELAFLLIDYKGGGLADAFAAEGRRLPHLAGTITNLDGASVRRSLVALQGELRRRQELFRRARRLTGEATMDVYRYLSFWRQGVLEEPCPHLVVIADEFAELKDQQPEFMDELVSAARIGRSLGVHLVLATQRPAGVVDDQIWSNARFKICLKVADAADSREMIRTDAAARISQVGRFYLLVGYNESLTLGQAAWAGAPYVPRERFEPERDLAVELLGEEGQTVARLRPDARGDVSGTQLDAVLAAISEAGERTGRRARPLWLPPLPGRITLAELGRRYGPVRTQGLVATVGELDDPEHQRRERLVADLAELGNVLIYGSQGSGADELACAMAVSLAQARPPRALWIYAVDAGPGTLAALGGLPHCGGVVTADDGERLGHLLRMLGRELAERRRRRVERAGALGRDAGASTPRIVVAIAGLAALEELRPEVADELVALTREGPRLGVHFVVSAGPPVTVRPRLRANFGLELPLALPDAADYASVLGHLGGAACPCQDRRGLVRRDGRVLEFQGAAVATAEGGEGEVIAAVAAARAGDGPGGAAEAGLPRAIPRLPTVVTARDMGPAPVMRALPAGFDRLAVEPVWVDLSGSAYTLVLGNDPASLARYLRGVVSTLAAGSSPRWRAIDTQGLLAPLADARVASGARAAAALVRDVVAGAADVELLLLTSVVQTMAALDGAASAGLAEWLASERGSPGTAVVAATELWRARSLYQDWWKVVSALGNGVWVGGGLAEQTALPFGRLRPEYRVEAATDDGFVVCRGEVTPVRLVAGGSAHGAPGVGPASSGTCAEGVEHV